MKKILMVTAATLILFSSFAYVVGEEILNNQHKSKVVIYEVSKDNNEKWEKDYKELMDSKNMEEYILSELESTIDDERLYEAFRNKEEKESFIASISEKISEIRLLSDRKDKQSAFRELLHAINNFVKELNDNLEIALKEDMDIVVLTEGVAELQAKLADMIPKMKGLVTHEAYLEQSQKLSDEVKRTISLKIISIANVNYIEAQKLRSEAEKTYLQASKFGDEQLVFSTLQNLLQAIEHEKQMQEIKQEFEFYPEVVH